MKLLPFACLLATASAAVALTTPNKYFAPDDPPTCFVANGRTIVQYEKKHHLSWKCSHVGAKCTCVNKHPTHEFGGCQEFDHTSGKTHAVGGDCSNTGLNPTPAPTPAPTNAPTKAPTKTPTKAPTAAPTNAPTPNPVTTCPNGVPSGPSIVANKKCRKVKFITNGCASAGSGGPFTVDGYGTLPTSCSSSTTASCEITLCDQPKLVVKAGTSDRWVFKVEIDGVAATPKETCGSNYGVASECCGGTSLETDQHTHLAETFTYPGGKSCHDVQFITNGCASAGSGGPFTVDGYGTLPTSCSSSTTASCTVQVCGQSNLVVKAGTTDRWVFNVKVDGQSATPKETCGSNYGVASECCGGTSLETDQHTHLAETFTTSSMGNKHQCSCNPGYYGGGTYNEASGYPACTPFGGSCTNGALIAQASRTQNNHCGSCNKGYYLSNKTCKAATCANGSISGTKCTCNTGYVGGGSHVSGSTYPECKLGCVDVTFQTNGCVSAGSGGPFHLDGYGDLPLSCSSSTTASCTVKLCGQPKVKLTAKTGDRWVFNVKVNGRALTPAKTCGSNYGVASECCGGTGLETDQWTHIKEEFHIPTPVSGCKDVTFKTNGCVHAGSSGPFEVAGYGTLPSSCSSSTTASCTIKLCNQPDVLVTAKTGDRWVFNVKVGSKTLSPKFKCGSNYGTASECCGGTGLETDQWTHVHETFTF